MALDTSHVNEAFTDVSYRSFANPEDGGFRSEYSEMIGAMGLLDSKEARASATDAMVFKNQLPVMVLSEFEAMDDNKDGTLDYGEVSGVNADYDEEPTRFAAAVLMDGRNEQLKVTEDKSLSLSEVYGLAQGSTPLEGDAATAWGFHYGQLSATGQIAPEAPISLDKYPHPTAEVQTETPTEIPTETPTETPIETQTETPTETETTTDPAIEALKTTLTSPNSSPEDQLKAVKALVAAGQTTMTITDADGNSLNVRLAVTPIAEGSPNNYVHMYAVDASGKESIVLRAISNGDGFVQQRDATGEFVSYVGSKWKRDHADSVFNEE